VEINELVLSTSGHDPVLVTHHLWPV